MKIKTEDKIVQQVLRKMDERSLIGQKKYGATMMQEIEGQEKDLDRFLIDVQEELMDALLYIEAARRCLTDEVEEVMLNRIEVYEKTFKRKKGPVQSKKISYDGINFASGLERYMYMALRKAKITSLYEGQTFELSEAFEFPFESYERCGNGKGEYKNRGNKKILNIKYTPDFVGKGFIIETKGRANESFPLRWKLFKKLITERRLGPLTLYKPQNHKECDETVRLILAKLKE